MTDMSEAARASGAVRGEDSRPLPLAGLKVIDLTLARGWREAVQMTTLAAELGLEKQ